MVEAVVVPIAGLNVKSLIFKSDVLTQLKSDDAPKRYTTWRILFRSIYVTQRVSLCSVQAVTTAHESGRMDRPRAKRSTGRRESDTGRK